MQPRHGARITLRLQQTDPSRVSYAVELELPSGTHPAQASVRLGDGEVQLAAGDPTTPDWPLDVARALLRSEWRARRVAGGSPWPRRITRWRAAPADVTLEASEAT